MKLGICAAAVFAAMTGAALAQNGAGVAGRWLTQDGKGVIAIAPCGNSICGKIDWMKPPAGANPNDVPLDKHNHDPARQRRPMCGLPLIYGFQRDGANPNRWTDGSIYDPESGDTYHANITLEDPNHLRLRGYIGIPLLGESQIWTRADSYPHCHAG